ncbi:hypothetical protein GCM10023346_38800 [Arthrobacter gyeryongensis]|uniref:Uncharacterized protein n=1 Tax=Arthrobacter gyeryongensis TaxID=1650592 RepID=A0ABP9SRF2_9MICC
MAATGDRMGPESEALSPVMHMPHLRIARVGTTSYLRDGWPKFPLNKRFALESGAAGLRDPSPRFCAAHC